MLISFSCCEHLPKDPQMLQTPLQGCTRVVQYLHLSRGGLISCFALIHFKIYSYH